MNLKHEVGNAAIRDVITSHPRIGEILQQYDIGCVTCGVGICLLKDVVAIHALGAEAEARIEAEINAYLHSSELLAIDGNIPLETAVIGIDGTRRS